ncbi:MAG: hypothetical protein EZS28_041787, partial [Streblomastix strix]
VGYEKKLEQKDHKKMKRREDDQFSSHNVSRTLINLLNLITITADVLVKEEILQAGLIEILVHFLGISHKGILQTVVNIIFNIVSQCCTKAAKIELQGKSESEQQSVETGEALPEFMRSEIIDILKNYVIFHDTNDRIFPHYFHVLIDLAWSQDNHLQILSDNFLSIINQHLQSQRPKNIQFSLEIIAHLIVKVLLFAGYKIQSVDKEGIEQGIAQKDSEKEEQEGKEKTQN